MSIEPNTIGNRIKKIRELKNFTQEHMAKQLRMSQTGYSKIECGESDVTYSKLQEIAKVLGITTEELVLFDQQKYFNSFNNVKGNNNGSIVINDIADELRGLYQDKIKLLERLLEAKEKELNAK